MSYIKANDVLPQEILEVIQKYVDGEYLYIPRKECNKKFWGENTAIRNENKIRNRNIYEDYKSGTCIKTIATDYYLSEKSIQRIISEMKK
ncbi:CD3324 family protein [Clostridium akagii]|uniref:CD3324 family protein n=1 Tax=Clostridium akagii TaxID=91623 RepID=UPI0004789B73|nr:CD3324 family protein [Clostridium akagii]